MKATMFPNPNFADYVIILFGLVFCFKRVAQMERYPDLRDTILTSIVGAILLLFFVGLVSSYDNPVQYDCACADHFTLSEF
ncbi:MAG TPA: hypothetical protein VK868_10850 [Pyrinomonadaceae bacterium]|nr:hypothetical protein [Pyrinomonadaceae bacterium]